MPYLLKCGGGIIGGVFRAKICVPAPWAPTSVLTQNKGPDTGPHFSNPSPFLRRASMSPPAPPQSNFQVALGDTLHILHDLCTHYDAPWNHRQYGAPWRSLPFEALGCAAATPLVTVCWPYLAYSICLSMFLSLPCVVWCCAVALSWRVLFSSAHFLVTPPLTEHLIH